MNTAHLHLMLNHLPVLGAPMLLALLAHGLGRRLPEVAPSAIRRSALGYDRRSEAARHDNGRRLRRRCQPPSMMSS